jgi:AraC-like DNA-binding protein
MQKELMLNSILNYLKTDIMTVELSQCTDKWHDYDFTPAHSRMYYILNGEGRIVIGGKEFFPKAGQFLIMPANHLQSYEAINDNPYLKYWIHFNCESAGKSIFDIIEIPYVITVKSTSAIKRINRLFDEMIEHFSLKSFVSNIILESHLRELLAIYLSEAKIENIKIKSSKDNERYGKILKYIDENIHSKITVEDLAGELYLHPNYFIKYFKNNFGASPAKYINSRKIELACDYMRNENMTITEIASSLSFNDIYQFSKVFKKYTGFTPSYYKKYIAAKTESVN